MRMGDAGAIPDIEVISTGSLGLDIALGVGGVPKGRIVEIYGPESSGKRQWLSTSWRNPRSRAAPRRL